MLESSSISSCHVHIQKQSDAIYIQDLDSTNGTTVNGVLIGNYKLKHNDVIALGNYTLKFSASVELRRLEAQNSKSIQIRYEGGDEDSQAELLEKGYKIAQEADVGPYFLMLTGKTVGKKIKLSKKNTYIGKEEGEPALIRRDKGKFFASIVNGSETGSADAPLINSMELSEEVELVTGDVLNIDDAKLEFNAS